jgi:hypothetical protein
VHASLEIRLCGSNRTPGVEAGRGDGSPAESQFSQMGATAPKTLRKALATLINSPRRREILASALDPGIAAAACGAPL